MTETRSVIATLSRDLAVERNGWQAINLDFKRDLQIEQGGSYALTGPNGSGKSTFLGTLCAEFRPSKGKVEVLGQNPTDFTRETKAKIGYVTQPPDIPDFLPANKAVKLLADSYRGLGIDGVLERFRELAALLNIRDDDLQKPVRSMTPGGLSAFAFAFAMSTQPELLLLDEPFASMDPERQEAAKLELSDECERRKMTTIVATHQFDFVERHSTDIVVLFEGRVRVFEEKDSLLARYREKSLRNIYREVVSCAENYSS